MVGGFVFWTLWKTKSNDDNINNGIVSELLVDLEAGSWCKQKTVDDKQSKQNILLDLVCFQLDACAATPKPTANAVATPSLIEARPTTDPTSNKWQLDKSHPMDVMRRWPLSCNEGPPACDIDVSTSCFDEVLAFKVRYW